MASRTAGWQNVVGADGLVAVGDGGLFTNEQRAVVGQALKVMVAVLDV